ncbi:MAG: L-2-amino-thiazoline-4-carboxylic acid hydrolase [Anaeroplasma bactoclasticum]|nr:L-2-amino-thiazoline-4-carboxylic acid hydrolase [Anaeroplasma bactoclasticum]
MEKEIKNYVKLYKNALKKKGFPDAKQKASDYENKFRKMLASEAYKQHDVYPTIHTPKIYAVIAMCLMLKEYNLSNDEILDFLDFAFRKAKRAFNFLSAILNVLPNSYKIAKKWNNSDHEKRVVDKSCIYDYFSATDEKIEYKVSKCMYVEMFDYYGIRELCKFFCKTDERIYANLPHNIKYIRHSELATGDVCHDEIINRRLNKRKH